MIHYLVGYCGCGQYAVRGVFTDKARAESECTSKDHFVAEITIDQPIGDTKPVHWYPRRQSTASTASPASS